MKNAKGEDINPALYRIEAYWPNSTFAPKVEYAPTFANSLDKALILAMSKQHTTITVRIDALEVIRLWGQLTGLP